MLAVEHDTSQVGVDNVTRAYAAVLTQLVSQTLEYCLAQLLLD